MTPRSQSDLDQALKALAAKSIQADVPHLLESIRRQFANPLEYVRELIANGLDAGATAIRVRGRWLEGKKFPLQILFEDDGKGMGRAEIERYLTVFESFKDGDGSTVGRHGVGKLSPWADSTLGSYMVDTCDGKERTILHLDSVRQGNMRVYQARGGPAGTTVTLEWPAREAQELDRRMEGVIRVAEEYCRYASRPIHCEYRDSVMERLEKVQIVHAPENDGWIALESVDLPGGICKLWYRLDGGGGGFHFYQGGIRLCLDPTLFDTMGWNDPWSPSGLQFLADSQAFEVPISRNAVKRNEAYYLLGSHLREKVMPALVEAACRRLERKESGVFGDQDESLVIAYLCQDFFFRPAKEIPLFPVLPFGKASVGKLTAWRRLGPLRVFQVQVGPLDSPPQAAADMLDAARLTSVMRKMLETHLGPLQDVDFDKDVMELPTRSSGSGLSRLELRFQKCLVLHRTDQPLLPETDEESQTLGSHIIEYALRRFGKLIRGEDQQIGGAAEIPSIRFRLGRLVKMDGRTPATSRKFLSQGKEVVLNLNHPDLERHLRFAAKDPLLAGHWCLREFLLSGEVEQFRYLSQEVREALIQQDAAARCLGEQGSHTEKVPRIQCFRWSDDEDDWRQYDKGDRYE